jgi:hypothetical protein
VDDHSWTFSRGEQRLEIQRKPVENGYLLTVTSVAPSRSFFFGDLAALVLFQTDMEAFVLNTGWSFHQFAPERRSGIDRRQWPRVTERRRWWTDARRQTDEAPHKRRGGRRPRH